MVTSVGGEAGSGAQTGGEGGGVAPNVGRDGLEKKAARRLAPSTWQAHTAMQAGRSAIAI